MQHPCQTRQRDELPPFHPHYHLIRSATMEGEDDTTHTQTQLKLRNVLDLLRLIAIIRFVRTTITHQPTSPNYQPFPLCLSSVLT